MTPSAAVRGGVERIIDSLARGLPGHEIEVVVGLAKGGRFHRPELYRREYPRLACVEIDGGTGTREGRLRAIRRAIRDTCPDVVLAARVFDAYEAVTRWKEEGRPIRLAVTIQSYEPEYILDLARYSDFVDLCITSGRLVADAVERFGGGLPPDRIRSIPGGVAPARRRVRREPGAPLRIAYVGRLEAQQKRVLDLAPVLERLSRSGTAFRCVVAGSGPAEAELRRRVRDAGVDGQVHFRGWLSTDELYATVYPETDVLLHFAAWEGITIAPREAMAHGAVPVVSAFLGCRRDAVFRDGENAIVFPVGDVEAASAAVRGLALDRAEWSRLSSAASESQTGICSEEGATRAWAEELHRICDRPPRVGRRGRSPSATPDGRLTRIFGPAVAESIRRAAGIRFAHAEPGGEWPHGSGADDSGRASEMLRFARETEDRLAHGVSLRARS